MKDYLKSFLKDFKSASLKGKLKGISFMILLSPVLLSAMAMEARDEGASEKEITWVLILNSLVSWGVLLSAILL